MQCGWWRHHCFQSLSAKNKQLLNDKKGLLIQNKIEIDRLAQEKANYVLIQWLSSNCCRILKKLLFWFQDEAVDAAIKAKCKRLHNFTSVRIVDLAVACLVLFVTFSNQHKSSWKPQEGTWRKKRRNQGRICVLFDFTVFKQPGLQNSWNWKCMTL